MTRYALLAALGASLAAILGFWLWWGAREQVASLRAENRGLQEAAEITHRWINQERERNARLIRSIEELANEPQTFGCGPSVGRALDLLRNQ